LKQCDPVHITLPSPSGGAVVADQPAREADQDWREGRQPWRCVTFQMAEVAVSRQMFQEILSLIARLWAPPAPA
jgi:hypothetical protein